MKAPSFHYTTALSLIALFAWGSSVCAQQQPSTDPVLLGDPTISSPASQAEEKSSWMMESPLGKVGWPELKMPKVEFKPPWKSSTPGQPNWFARQTEKARLSARSAAMKTRDAWNGGIDRMKLVLPGQGPKDGAQVASTEQKRGFWERLMSPGASEEPPIEDLPMIAQQPEDTLRR